MNYNSNYEELVSKYLEGDMTDVEKQDFEHQLAKDDALKEEYQFQKDIIQEVQSIRKAELISRLNNIQVPTNYIYQYIGIKTAALVAVTVLIGLGAYYFLNNESVQSTSQVDLTKDQIVVADEESIPQMPEAETATKDQSIEELESPSENLSATSSKKQTEKQEKIANAPTPTNIPKPEVSTPDVESAFNGEEFESEEDPLDNVNSLDAVNKAESEKVEVETISDNKNGFHYQFYNNKLYLYGNFDDMPYEIIEFNADKTKLYFLYYDSTYYSLDNNQLKAAPLQELSDEELIDQLDELRTK